MDISYEKPIFFSSFNRFPRLFFLIAQVLAILLEYVLVDHTEIDICLVRPIFSSFGFWYFRHLSCMIFFLFFFHLAHLALQNVNKYYIIFSYFHNFVIKSDQKPKMKNWTKETFDMYRKNLFELVQTCSDLGLFSTETYSDLFRAA